MRTWLRIIGYIIILSSVFIIFLILTVNYTSILYMLGGILAVPILYIMIPKIIKPGNFLLGFVLLLLISSILVIIFGPYHYSYNGYYYITYNSPMYNSLMVVNPIMDNPLMYNSLTDNSYAYYYYYPTCEPGSTYSFATVREYHAIIEPINFSLGTFNVSEDGSYDLESYPCNSDKTLGEPIIEKDKKFSLIKEQAISGKRGFTIRELTITPLKNLSLDEINYEDTIATIELRNIPRNSFYEARDAQKIDLKHYLDNDIVRWDPEYLNEGIKFAYIASPFYFIRGLIKPLIGVSYDNQWMIALLSSVVTGFVTPIVKPVVIGLSKNRLKSIFERSNTLEDKEEDKENAVLIISGKGDQEEIDIKKKPK